jgi:iron(III) transport system substrate-binding protein
MIIVFSVISCDRGSPSEESSTPLSPPPLREVVVYVSTDEAIARPILEAFSKESGITVRARYDSENSKTTALAAMLRTEHDAPRADVFWSGECFASAQLGREGVIAPWRCMRSGELPDSLRGESGWWHGFAPRMRVLVYDPKRITVEQLPQSMLDLATPAFGMSVAMADPRFGTTRGHIGAFASQMEWREVGSFQKWVDGFASNKPLILAGGNAAVVDAVIRKEVDFGLTDSDDVYAAVANGAVLAMIPLRQFPSGESGGGPMLIPNSVSLVDGAPHPAEANALMIFLLQPKVTEWLHASRSGNFIIQLNPPTNVSKNSIPNSANSALTPSAPPPSSPPDGLALMPGNVQSIRIQAVEDPFQYDQTAMVPSMDESVSILRKACIKDGAN